MSAEFASANLTLGQLNAIVKKLGGYDGALKFLRGETTIAESTRNWREEDGVIYFSVESDGTTGENWITRLESKGFRVDDYAKQMLRSSDFKPTDGVKTEIAVLKSELFQNNDLITNKIRAEANKRKLSKPNAEMACLIREKFGDKEIGVMGCWLIVVMHEPLSGFCVNPSLLGADCGDIGCWLTAYDGLPDGWWGSNSGFAFVVPQVSSELGLSGL